VSVHVAVVPAAAQAPLHPAKLLPPVAAAVSESCVPCTKVSLQSPVCDDAVIEQLMPLPLTVPVPVLLAARRIVTVYVGGGGGGGGAAKLALTASASLSVTVQVALEPDATHASPHARKVLPPVAAAVSVTTLPRLRLVAHVLANVAPEIAQSIPFPATVPVPVLFGPARTSSASSGGVVGSGALVNG
jgi:hypothetical protein